MCEFGKVTVTYPGKQVDHGQVRPVNEKVAAVLSYLVPTARSKLFFLCMTRYYWCFCKKFYVVVAPLTKLDKPAVSFVWTDECCHAFDAA